LLKGFRDSRVLKGRGFSRAARDTKINTALAAEVVGVIEQLAFQRLQRPVICVKLVSSCVDSLLFRLYGKTKTS
jgi:hypothetical protein